MQVGRQQTPGLVRRRQRQAGLTLVELIVAFTILLVLSTMAVPLARYQVRRAKEKDLNDALHEIRHAIDKYKDMCDIGKIDPGSPEGYCYPPTLEVLVDGAKMQNTIAGDSHQSGKMRFLRHIPKDPMTGEKDWGKRAMQDEADTSSWGGQNVFDVFSKTVDKAGDGTPYAEW